MSLQIIDIIFIIIILVVGFRGLIKGFFSQVLIIAGVLLGLFFSYFFSDDLMPYISNIIGDRESNNLLAFVLIFIVIMLLAMLINKIVKNKIEDMGSAGLDKILGFSFGLVQGLVICIGITVLLTIQPLFNPEPIFVDSFLGKKIISTLPQLEKLLPNLEEYLPNTEEIMSKLDEHIPETEEILNKLLEKDK